MPAVNDLFFLIKSLSPAEKRYFRLFSGLHSSGKQNNYLLLFDAIDKQSSYDEDAIKKKFKSALFVKQLTVTKNKLGSKLLESLRSFHAGSKDASVSYKLRESLDNLEILKNKQAYSQLQKELRRAKKLAQENDAFSYLLILLQFEIEGFMAQRGNNMLQGLHELLEEQKQVFENIHYQQAYTNLNNDVFIRLKMKIGVEETSQQTALRELLENDLLNNSAKARNFQSKIYFHDIKAYCHIRLKNYKEAYEHYKEVVNLWETTKNQIQKKPLDYIKALCNYLNGCSQLQKLEDYPSILQKIKEIETKHKIKESKVIQTRLHHELLYYLLSGKLKEGQIVAPQIDKSIEENKANIHISRQMAIYYNLMILYFFCDDYGNALEQLNRLSGLSKNSPREDIRNFCKLLLLIIHFELDNTELLHNLHRSAQRTIPQPSEFEQIVLANLRVLDKLEIWGRNEREQFFIDFKEDLEVYEEEKKHSYILGLEEIKYWLESKIKKQRLQDLYIGSL